MVVKSNQMSLIVTHAIVALSVALPAWAGGFPGGLREALGPRYRATPRARAAPTRSPRPGGDSMNRLRYWNEIAINASGLDHTPVASGENRVFGEQLGPGRSSRAMAIVHIAIFEAGNALGGGYLRHVNLPLDPNRALPKASTGA